MLGFDTAQKLKGRALEKEKAKDFKNIVILQVCIIFSALLLKDFLDVCEVCTKESSYILRDCLFLAVGGVYVLVLWDLLKDISRNRFLVYLTFFLIISTFTLALVVVNPFYKLFEEDTSRSYLFFIHFILFLVEALVIVYAIFDIFTGHKMSHEKLWGSACIYLMIGISFGSVFDLICIVEPGSLGERMTLGLESYTNCITYSMSVIGGQDPPFPNASNLIKNLGVIEAVWANLFVVLLVGRLLGIPDAPAAEVRDDD